MKRYNAVIIGLGKIGLEYDLGKDKKYILSYSRAFARHKGFRLTAGIDVDAKKLATFKRAYSAPALAYNDLKKALHGVEVVAIAAPAAMHLRILKDVLRHVKPRLVMMEKPLAPKMREAAAIVDLCAKRKVALYVNYFRRVDRGTQHLKTSVKKGALGKLLHVNIYYGKDLFENGSHFVDLMLYLFGEPQRVALADNRIKVNSDFLFYYKGFTVFFKSAPETAYNFKEMDFIFSKGRLRHLSLPATEVLRPSFAPCFSVKELMPVKNNTGYELDMEKFMFNAVDHAYSFLTKRGKLASSGNTALRTLEICSAISER